MHTILDYNHSCTYAIILGANFSSLTTELVIFILQSNENMHTILDYDHSCT